MIKESIPQNLYIHVPFCDSKCRYCAFYSIIPANGEILSYAKLPAAESALRGFTDYTPETVYCGGGTPSLLGAEGFEILTRSFREIGVRLNEATEWTVELNPASVTIGLLRTLRHVGVNRISIGVQSFNDDTLRRIGRRHNAEAAIHAIKLAVDAGFDDVGFDIIAGLPGVTDNEWQKTLADALQFAPQHISIYPLILEKGTPLFDDTRSGRITLPDTNVVMNLLSAAEDTLAREGFIRYEISNYGLPGRFCKHNLAVWRGEDYLGLGPAAASRNGLKRWTNAPDIGEYRRSIESARLPPMENEEKLDELSDAEERFVFAVRLSEGIVPRNFAVSHPVVRDRVEGWERTLDSLADNGITTRLAPGRWCLTRRGREVADAVCEQLL